ncbi:YggS family pyridoxal phosphate-dependent enzyme [candidate division KSB1 bacterium]|nr:MAG: YggS family pyridoxal phosphate-dependent enzyme [candidate division KSB1 bacterium]RKY88942.1 MAG: YggS family pyridoxal phosphate-dependent enzyme [candidate division KSB1 bacterium]
MSKIRENIDRLQERIAHAAERSGRDPQQIRLVAVSKTRSVEEIREAITAGITEIGENRVQEAWKKYQIIGDAITWHMVGHLQTNKVKRALQFFQLIHSLDSFHLAEEIERQAQTRGKVAKVLIEVNTSGEATKYGVPIANAQTLIEQVANFSHLQILGLMTIGPFTDDVNAIRSCFRQLRNLQEQISRANIPNVEMRYLSMGMTHDFEIAIEEGANILRIGTAIFGPRTE